ncbi:unnamed protein product [Heligmosomoides polygyrus]|uniref:Reverse transcriptase domain-containing protein n=1 Tax=Heligmosomoides polygyrus TaxID=6339 RepID=A0A183FUP7_HELPZ|nr:unnamed protein product [Heligmosomoides polygyrus]
MTRKRDVSVGVYQGSASLRIEERRLGTILYVEDIALVAERRQKLDDKVQLWQVALEDNGHRRNVRRTKLFSSERCARLMPDCQGEAIEKVEKFRFFGSHLSREGIVVQPVGGRINAAWLKWRE